jgi:hypothetical protein
MAILPPDYTDTPFTGQVYQNNSNKVKVEFEYGNQLIKHLSGQHDQASHGRGGGSVAVDVGQVTRKTATPAQVEALGEYFADGYESINGFARGKTTVAEAEYNGVERVQEKIAIIDNVIATTAPTIEEMTVYRGVSVKVAAGLAKSPVGTVIVNKGFVSTSQNKKVADSFAKGAVLNIRVPKGVKAFDVSKYVNKKEYENEMIFARDTKMVITNTSDNTIFVDLLP